MYAITASRHTAAVRDYKKNMIAGRKIVTAHIGEHQDHRRKVGAKMPNDLASLPMNITDNAQ